MESPTLLIFFRSYPGSFPFADLQLGVLISTHLEGLQKLRLPDSPPEFLIQ